MTSSVQPSPVLSSRFLPPGAAGPRLGALTYLAGAAGVRTPAGTELTVRMGAAGDAFTESWAAGEPVCGGEYAGLRYTGCRDFLFCVGRIPLSAEYSAATRGLYEDLFSLLARLGYKRLLRVWNYIGDINGLNVNGQEVYRDFCMGRSHALEQLGMLYGMPATTVIGADGDGIGVALLAAREAEPVNVENPRQTPAYHYPARYGPRSPNFARATYVPPGDDPSARGTVFVSGTASIIGHETVHAGDVRAQTYTALENVALLIGPENLASYDVPHTYGLSDLRRAKVYVRHAEDVPVVREICEQLLPADGTAVYLNADVCRGDLLMEIEGVAD